jgi:hypothetical protein
MFYSRVIENMACSKVGPPLCRYSEPTKLCFSIWYERHKEKVRRLKERIEKLRKSL